MHVFLRYVAIFCLLITVAAPRPAQAQTQPMQESVTYVGSTYDVHPVIVAVVVRTLQESIWYLDPLLEYAITNVSNLPRDTGYIVSVVGMIPAPGQRQNIVDHGRWFGRVYVYKHPNGELWGDLMRDDMTANIVTAEGYREISIPEMVKEQMHDPDPTPAPEVELAADYQPVTKQPIEAAADRAEADVYAAEDVNTEIQSLVFPWPRNLSAVYGVLGVHEGGFFPVTGSGYSAVDFVGAVTDGEGTWNTPVLVAMDDALVNWVCRDSDSIAINTWPVLDSGYPDPSGRPHMIYAHISPDTQILEGDYVTRGVPIATLRMGDFDNTCGYADQSDSTFHVHISFADTGTWEIENCRLDTSTEDWTCADGTVVQATERLNALHSDVPVVEHQASTNIWDSILEGVVYMVLQFGGVFPTGGDGYQQANSIGVTLVKLAGTGIAVSYLVGGSFVNLAFPMLIMVLVFLMEIFRTGYALWRMFLKAIPAAN